MEFPVSVGDQQAYHNLLSEGTQYLDGLTDLLTRSYNELEPQRVDIEDLGHAVEALIFASEKLKAQQATLEEYRKELRKEIVPEQQEEK